MTKDENKTQLALEPLIHPVVVPDQLRIGLYNREHGVLDGGGDGAELGVADCDLRCERRGRPGR